MICRGDRRLLGALDTRGKVLVSLVEKHFGGKTANMEMSQEDLKNQHEFRDLYITIYLLRCWQNISLNFFKSQISYAFQSFSRA